MAAALSRHGPCRLLPGADDGPGDRRLSRHHVLRPPPGAVAEADVGQSARPSPIRRASATILRRAASMAMRRRSTCRACAWPASAATWCAPTCCNSSPIRLSVAGFRSHAFLPSYGMAETTLAISFVDADAPIRIDSIDRHALKTEARAVPAKGEACAQLRGLRQARCRTASSRSATSAGQPLGERRVGPHLRQDAEPDGGLLSQ